MKKTNKYRINEIKEVYEHLSKASELLDKNNLKIAADDLRNIIVAIMFLTNIC
ncbi:MAG: hypothetical protein QXO65_03465 [Candidatus Aenigmatarchaeota archaeon]